MTDRIGYTRTKLNEFDSNLEKYSTTIGLGGFVQNPEAQAIMAYGFSELKGLSAEECTESAFILSQYSFFIQKELNRHKARLDWAEHNLDALVAKEGAMSDQMVNNQVRRQIVVLNNEYAKELDKIATEERAKVNELSFLANGISFMANKLDELGKTKRSARWNK